EPRYPRVYCRSVCTWLTARHYTSSIRLKSTNPPADPAPTCLDPSTSHLQNTDFSACFVSRGHPWLQNPPCAKFLRESGAGFTSARECCTIPEEIARDAQSRSYSHTYGNLFIGGRFLGKLGRNARNERKQDSHLPDIQRAGRQNRRLRRDGCE